MKRKSIPKNLLDVYQRTPAFQSYSAPELKHNLLSLPLPLLLPKVGFNAY